MALYIKVLRLIAALSLPPKGTRTRTLLVFYVGPTQPPLSLPLRRLRLPSISDITNAAAPFSMNPRVSFCHVVPGIQGGWQFN